jgi:hypothetical protein
VLASKALLSELDFAVTFCPTHRRSGKMTMMSLKTEISCAFWSAVIGKEKCWVGATAGHGLEYGTNMMGITSASQWPNWAS